MQYLLQDLIKLPLADRLIIVEKLIGTLVQSDYETQIAQIINKATLNK